MPVFPSLSLLLLIGLMATPAQAADVLHHTCLTKAEQRAVVASGHAVPLAEAIKSVSNHRKKPEVLRARLCRRGDNLVYELTLLARSGKVSRVTVDAENGELIKGR